MNRIRCDPIVRLYVGGRSVWNSTAEENKELIEPNYTYRSETPISKNTQIKIEVWDDETMGKPQFIESTGGTVTEWLNRRNRAGTTIGLFQNSIQTFVMWKDVYKK